MRNALSDEFAENVAEARSVVREMALWRRLHDDAIESSRQALRESWDLLALLQADHLEPARFR